MWSKKGWRFAVLFRTRSTRTVACLSLMRSVTWQNGKSFQIVKTDLIKKRVLHAFAKRVKNDQEIENSAHYLWPRLAHLCRVTQKVRQSSASSQYYAPPLFRRFGDAASSSDQTYGGGITNARYETLFLYRTPVTLIIIVNVTIVYDPPKDQLGPLWRHRS